MKETEENLRLVVKDVIPLIRFPIMTMQEMVTVVSPSNLLDRSQQLEIFTYIANDVKPSIRFSAKRRRNTATFTWDPSKKHDGLTISNDGLTITSTGTQWKSCAGDTAFSEGVHQWQVTLTSYDTSNTYNVAIGVIPTSYSQWQATTLCGYGTTPGWVFVTGQGRLSHQGNNYTLTPYGAACRQGDVIGVSLDLDQHSLEFFYNGVSMGTAFTTIQGPVYPVISLVQQQTVDLSFNVF